MQRDHATFGSEPTCQSDDRNSEPDYLLRPTRHGPGRRSGRTKQEYTAASERHDHATFQSGPTRQSDERDSEQQLQPVNITIQIRNFLEHAVAKKEAQVIRIPSNPKRLCVDCQVKRTVA